MRENEKRRELLKASRQTFIINKKSLPYSVLSVGFYSQSPIQITKITKQTLLQWRQIRKRQKVTKESKSQKQHEQWQEGNFAATMKFCKGWEQKFATLRKFAALAKLQGLLHLSVVLLVLPFSTLIPNDFFMLELNPYLWYK